MKELAMSQIKMVDFGKDHWSLLAYVETLCVDTPHNKGMGQIDKRRLNCNPKRHPAHAVNEAMGACWRDEYSTRLSGYFLENGKTNPKRMAVGNDDWDCLNDLESERLIQIMSEINGFVLLTDRGREMAGRIRAHKSKGGSFATFSMAETVSS
jgi:hypothetical protein